jgi:predicted PurR-regulated permease PerM
MSTTHARAATVGSDDVPSSALPRSIVVLLGIAAAVLAGIGIRGAAEIVAPAMLALVLTIAVLPVRTWARHHGWPGWLATLFALVASYAILLVLVVGTVVCIVHLVEVLPQYSRSAEELTGQAQQRLGDLGLSPDATGNALQQLDPAKIVDLLTGLLSGVLGFVSGLFFLVTLMFFFVTAVAGFGPRMAALARSKPALATSAGRFVTSSQRYLVMTALFGAIVGVLDAGALWLLAVPLPLVWGFFSFLTNFIPNIGFVIGVIPPALLALLDSGVQKMLLVILVYSVLNVTIQTFIQPRFVGASVGLSAEVTFLSLVVWAFLLGPLGAVLAVPMTLLFRAVFIDADKRAAWVTPLIATTAEPEPEPEGEPEAEPEAEPDPEPGGATREGASPTRA